MYVKCIFKPNPIGSFSGLVKITRPDVKISTFIFLPPNEILGYATIFAFGLNASGIMLSTPTT